MTAPVTRPAVQTGRRGRLWWLPAGGQGNGLDDQAWAPVLEVSGAIVAVLLDVLRQAGVPAYAAPAHRAHRAGLRPRDGGKPDSYQLWVGVGAYGEAESALMTAMPSIRRQAARHGDRAWR
jgi:hypothetical protein